jgi:hypothetical protein
MKMSKLFLIMAYFHFWKYRTPLQDRKLQKKVEGIQSYISNSDSKCTSPDLIALVGILYVFAALSAVTSKNKGIGVPKFAEYLLYLFLSKKDREHLIGDLAEEYLEVRAKFGQRAANFWYYKQVISSIWPLSRKAVRWTLIAGVGEWVRRHM